MFNRALQVKMVKTTKSEPVNNTHDTTIEGIAAHAAYAADRITMKVAATALAYVVLDTVRQVLVAHANK